MKSISLITIHVGFNFGSVLQTIASCKILSERGYKVTVVDYRPTRVTFKRYLKQSLTGFKHFVGQMLVLPVWLKNRKVYSNYLAKYCTLSAPIFDKDDFITKCPKADIYVSGSDQLWNSIHNRGFNGRYFFNGIEGTKISFSSSIGRTDIDDEELKQISKSLVEYKALSVRELSAQEVLKSLGYDSTVLIDPTFMLNKKDWEYYMSERLVKENYLLVYIPYNIIDKEMIYKTARNIAKSRGLKVVTFSWDHRDDRYADETIKFASPGDFLSLFHYADFVITNSFHGTAFSVNFNKQFVVYMPSQFPTRIESILKLFGLEDLLTDRVLTDEEIKPIDFTSANKALDKEREKVSQFLDKNF